MPRWSANQEGLGMYRRPRYQPLAGCHSGRESFSHTRDDPTKGRKGQWGELFPPDRAVLHDGWPGVRNPVTSIVDTIAKAAGGIREECQVRCSRPVRIRYNSMAIPSRKER